MFAKLRRYFISGLIVFLPVTLTVVLLVVAVNFADDLLGKYLAPYFKKEFGFYFRGLSILIWMWLIVLIGFFASNFFGRKLHALFEKLILKLPFFRQIYPAIKEIALWLFTRERLAFKQVVLVEYPRKGLYSLGFVTNESAAVFHKLTGKDLRNVFIPSAPGPLTGYVILVPRNEIIHTEISVEDAVKLIVSGGVVNPNQNNHDK